MQRLCIALALLALLIGGSIWSVRTVERTANDVAQALEGGEVEQAYRRWMDAQTQLGALLLHDELDEISRLFARVRAAQDGQRRDEVTLDHAELVLRLRHLPDLEQPLFRNLF